MGLDITTINEETIPPGSAGIKKSQLTEEEGKLYTDNILHNIISKLEKDNAEKQYAEISKEAKFDLDKALDTYDPTFPNYIPSEDSFEFFMLMRLVAGEDFEFKTPIAHYFMVDILLGYITDVNKFPYSSDVCSTINLDDLAIGFMESRGLAKSTIVISFFGVYSAIKGKLPNGIGSVYFYVVLAASSRGGARVNALAVKSMCEDSVFLNEYFEEMRFTETESEFIRKGKTLKKNRSFLIRYQGIATGIRGSRYGERRPDGIIFDDAILNTAAAYSKVMSENLEEVMHSDATNALKGGGKGRVILCFTPFHYGDVNTKAILNGSFTPVVIPMARTFDAEKDVTIDMIESSWTAMHPNESILKLLKKAKRSKKLGSFMQERMLRLTSGSERLVPESCLQWCSMKHIVKNIHAYNIYISTDYTTTSGEDSDYSGVATWAVSNNEDIFLVGLTLRKMGMEDQYKITLSEAAKWKRRGKHVEIGVEVDGNQGAHLYSLEQEMLKTGNYYSFARQKGYTGERKGILSKNTGVNKHERFRIASQHFLNGKIWLPEELKNTEDMQEFIAQIRGATHKNFTRADDGPDLVTQIAVSIDVVYPTDYVVDIENVTNKTNDVSDIWLDIEDNDVSPRGSTVF